MNEKDHVKLHLLLEVLNPQCLKYHHEYDHYGQCGLKEREDPGTTLEGMDLVQCGGRIKDCELENFQEE